MQPASDGSFTVTVDKANEYTLHKKNAEITLTCPTGNSIQMESVGAKTVQKTLSPGNNTFMFPYEIGGSGVYSARFVDPTNDYKVSAITASPSTGFSYDPYTYIATGIKDGMKLTLTLAKNDKPYTLTLHIPPVDTEHNEFALENHMLSVKYMLGGKETLQTLPRDQVFKMGLSADNFPISVGPFSDMGDGTVGSAPVMGGYHLYLGTEMSEILQGSSFGSEITVDTPQSLTGDITYYTTAKRNYTIRNPSNAIATYGLFGNTQESVPYEGQMDWYNAEIQAGQLLTIRVNDAPETYKAILYIDEYDTSNFVEYRADENGDINIQMPWYPEFDSPYNKVVIELKKSKSHSALIWIMSVSCRWNGSLR